MDHIKKTIIIAILVAFSAIIATAFYYESRIAKLEIQYEERLRQARFQMKQDKEADNEDPYIKSEVLKTIRENFPAFQKCYQDHMKSEPEIKMGRIVFNWIITPEGKVRSPNIVHNPFKSATFEACISRVVAFMTFPAPPSGQEKVVKHTFNFADPI